MHNAYYEHHHKKVSSLFLKMSAIAFQTSWVALIVIIFVLIYTLIWWPPSLNIYYIIYILFCLFNYRLFGPFQILAWIDHRHFALQSNHCCCLFSALLMRISGQGTSNPHFQNTNINFQKRPNICFWHIGVCDIDICSIFLPDIWKHFSLLKIFGFTFPAKSYFLL